MIIKKNTSYNPLEKRIFKLKNPRVHFLCPLCATKRSLASTPVLGHRNYIQILLLTLIFTLIFYPLMELRGVFSFFVFWGLIEMGVRWYYRRQLTCKHCGFDAIWYKKDVKMAQKLVRKFWDSKTK